jgi:tetratricopeptide (TPR) repeat protein
MAKMRECIERAEEAGFLIPLSAARAELGVMYARLGRFEAGMELAEEGIAIARKQSPLAVPMALIAEAEILYLQDKLEEAESAIQDADVGKLPGPIRGAAGAHVDLLKGRLAAAEGDHARAIEIADGVIEWLQRLELRQYMPAALLLKGRAFVGAGRTQEAEAALDEARAHAKDMGYRRVLWEIDAELGALAAARGDRTGASELWDEAAAVVAEIAGTIEDEELRESFLSVPRVREVLATA